MINLPASKKPLVLICDDDLEILQSLNFSLKASFEVITANSVLKAKKLVKENTFDAAIIDLNFEGQELDGIHLLDIMTKEFPETYLIVLSGDTEVQRVVEATRRKLFEFIVKEGEYFDQLLSSLHASTQLKIARHERLRKRYLTQSPVIKNMLQKIDTIIRSQSDAPILILGETGSGKEFLAQHIAMNSGMPITSTNMAAIPKDMAESILFGHERGAFTGAIGSKMGLIEAANNGIFFLDEIGESTTAIQTKLLRVLQEKEIQPVGSNRTKKIKVRFIAATHRDLESLVSTGEFRLDLLQRLNTFIFKLPSLRERPEDIIFYANLFLDEHEEPGMQFRLTPDGEKELLAYHWPGNIRELQNVMTRIIVLSLNLNVDAHTVRDAIGLGVPKIQSQISRAEIVENNARRDEVIKAITLHNGIKRLAAKSLGVSEATLYRWVKELNLCTILSASKFKNHEEAIQ
ncbi:MAG: sigma-54 dependent transcriptional regulator [Bacteriovoracaceae bacterium]|nr:sigma-54 dependent transcriptional regulator [Bacteriovoracaceae bacterium]